MFQTPIKCSYGLVYYINLLKLKVEARPHAEMVGIFLLVALHFLRPIDGYNSFAFLYDWYPPLASS